MKKEKKKNESMNGNDFKEMDDASRITLIHRYHICVAVDPNVPSEDAHSNETNADRFYHTVHKCNSV